MCPVSVDIVLVLFLVACTAERGSEGCNSASYSLPPSRARHTVEGTRKLSRHLLTSAESLKRRADRSESGEIAVIKRDRIEVRPVYNNARVTVGRSQSLFFIMLTVFSVPKRSFAQ